MIEKTINLLVTGSSESLLENVTVYAGSAPGNAKRPYCVYSVANSYGGDLEGEEFARIDIEVFPNNELAAPEYGSAAEIARAVRRLFELVTGHYGEVCILNVKHLSTRDTLHRPTNQHGRRVELLFNYLSG